VTLKILAVSSEAFPLAKTGGLGDAVSGLCRSLHRGGGARVTLMLPAYRDTLRDAGDLREVGHLETSTGAGATLLAGVSPALGLPVLLVRDDALYDRVGLYVDDRGAEYPDNAIRFATLAQAAARVAQGIHGVPRPDIVHAHDWHAALVPLYLRQWRVAGVKSVLTLHNIAFQGIFPLDLAPSLGIETRYCCADGAEFWGQLNFLKAGIRYADLISVVSRNYAREILTPRFGCGLEGVLAERVRDMVPIPNGIDDSIWCPQADEYLPGRGFGLGRMGNKAVCKRELQRRFGLKEDQHATVMGLGSRMTAQKMADVAAQALPMALDTHPGLQVCIIGHGDKAIEAALEDLGRRYPGRCGVRIGFEEREAHLLHAGADVLLHGSRFEPFGLAPLYAMRYGTIPIGSKVGGMADTIVDLGAAGDLAAMRFASGVLFEGEAAADMARAIERTMVLRQHPELWQAMQRNAMSADFSWAHATPLYVSAYRALRPDLAPATAEPQAFSNTAAVMPRQRQKAKGLAAAIQAAYGGGKAAGPAGRTRGQRRGDPLPLAREASMP